GVDASNHSPTFQEATVRHPFVLGAVATTVALAAVGCGSSSKTTTTKAAAPASSYATPTTATSTTAAATGVAVVSKHGKPGVILGAGPKKLTVYLFEADTASSSSCTGECASVWPPVTSAGAPRGGRRRGRRPPGHDHPIGRQQAGDLQRPPAVFLQ